MVALIIVFVVVVLLYVMLYFRCKIDPEVIQEWERTISEMNYEELLYQRESMKNQIRNMPWYETTSLEFKAILKMINAKIASQ